MLSAPDRRTNRPIDRGRVTAQPAEACGPAAPRVDAALSATAATDQRAAAVRAEAAGYRSS